MFLENYPGDPDSDATEGCGLKLGLGDGEDEVSGDGLEEGAVVALGDGEGEGDGLGFIEGLGVALTEGLSEGLADGEGEGEGVGVGVKEGLGEGEFCSPKTCGFEGKNTDLNQNPETIKIKSKIPASPTVNFEGLSR